MSKIIIGIHGLQNKPQKKTLENWWKSSIREGLKAWGYNQMFYKFKLVYWADVLYPDPLNPQIKDEKHPLYLPCPYQPGKEFITKKPNKLRQKFLDYLEKQMDKMFLNDDLTLNFSAVSDIIIRRYFQDLNDYYSSKKIKQQNEICSVKEAIRNRLARVLKKYRHKQILLIAHSMGSIIAYDVLYQLEPEIKIDTFITLGSPLGMPIVMNKVASEQKRKLNPANKLATPNNIVRQWFNYSDLRDMVALNYNLADDYAENLNSIGPKDKIVSNNYEYFGDKNPHKSYGYLRTAEMAAALNEFLNFGRSKFSIKVNYVISKIVGKLG